MSNQENFYMLNELKAETIKQFYKRTVMAISIISISYVISFILFTILLVLKPYYCFFVMLIPMLSYLWIISYGAKYVNNSYRFKKTPDGTIVFKKRRNNYSTFVLIHAINFLISSIIRLICEIHNLMLIKKELSNVR